MDNFREEFERIRKELVLMGEDEKELGFWADFSDLMSDDEKSELLKNLKEELEELKKINKNTG